MAARAKNRKTSDDISIVTTGQISTKLDRIIPWDVFYQNCSDRSAPLHKMARASTRFAQTVPFRCTKWLPELKIEKKKKINFRDNIFSVTTRWISTKLDRIVLWEVLYQNCSNQFALLNKMAINAKREKISVFYDL